MSRIPYLDDLGDALEEAVVDAKRPYLATGPAAFAAAFIVVLALGGLLWLLRPAGEPATQPATTPLQVDDAVALPEQFARVPDAPVFEDGSRMHLGAVVVVDGEFVAVGDGDSGGVVLASSDGVTWERRAAPTAVSSLDAALVVGGELFVAGIDVALGPGLWAGGGETWRRLPLPASGYSAGSVRDLAPFDGRVIAVGQAIRGDGQQTAVVWHEEGDRWVRVVDSSFGGGGEIDANGAASDGSRLVVSGVWSDEPGGARAAVWVTNDLAGWRRVVLPGLAVARQSWATDVAWTGERFVAVGGAVLATGRAGAVWTSDDGLTWEWVAHDPSVLEADGAGSLVINTVEPVADGLLALGTLSDGAAFGGLVFTSADGTMWRRIELAAPNPIEALPSAAVENDGALVVVGGEAPGAVGAAHGAVWVSPVPEGVVEAAPPPTASQEAGAKLVLVPDVASPGSRVEVSVDLGGDQRPDQEASIVIVGPDGETEVCTIGFAAGVVRRCSFRPADAGVNAPGEVSVEARLGEDTLAQGALEIVPSGTVIARLVVSYTPRMGPLVQLAVVRNLGDAPLNVSGWTIDSVRRTDPYVLPEGIVLEPGESAGLIAQYQGARSCGEMSGRNFLLCPTSGTGPDDPNIHPGMEVYAGGIVLLDAGGNEIDTWSP